ANHQATALAGGLGAFSPEIRLVVTDQLGLSREHTCMADLVARVATTGITRDGVVPFVAKRATCNVLTEDGDGTASLLQIGDYQPVMGNQPLHLRRKALEESAWIEVVAHRAGEGRHGAVQLGQA